jgi:hypothetical protein
MTEYRIDELARRAGTTVRNVRADHADRPGHAIDPGDQASA